MASITTLLDGIAASLFRSQTNTNFSNLNTDKAEDSAVIHNTGTETIAGNKTFSDPPIFTGNMIIRNDGDAVQFFQKTDGTSRWAFFKNSSQDLVINRYNDSGVYQDSPFVISGTDGSILLNSKLVGNPDFYKYSITTSVASGNLTVALKNYEGNDPTPTKPVKIQIGGVIRTVSSAFSATLNSGTNWFNSGSAELATKEIDYFGYIRYSPAGLSPIFSRYPSANIVSDFSASGTYTNEKYACDSNGTTYLVTDPVVNIGRFNATLSAGAGYTWSLPGTSVIINRPIYETRWLDWQPSVTASGSMTIASLSFAETKYKISGDSLSINYSATYTTGGTASSDVISTVPFTFLSSSILGFSSPCYDSADFNASGIYQGNSIIIRKNGAAWTLGTGRVFGIHTFGRI